MTGLLIENILGVIVAALIGAVVGLGLVRLADYMPRFATTPHAKQLVPVNNRSLDVTIALGSAVAFGVLFGLYHLSVLWVLYAALFSFFLLIAIVDFKYRLILNVMTYPAIAVTIIIQVMLSQQSANPTQSLLRIALGGMMAFGIFYLTARLKPGDLGGGDIKLATLIGVLFGFPGVLWALLVGAGSGAVIGLIMASHRRKNDPKAKVTFAYAPFLCLGAVVVLLLVPLV